MGKTEKTEKTLISLYSQNHWEIWEKWENADKRLLILPRRGNYGEGGKANGERFAAYPQTAGKRENTRVSFPPSPNKLT